MILGNIHASDKGRKVKTLATAKRMRQGKGFDGTDFDTHRLPPKPRLQGVVTSVESHGMNPWTRYSVRYTDGSIASGLILGVDIKFI